MDSQHILPFALRFLPPIIVLALGFYAASDKKSRERWTQLLYQAGSLRPEQRDDPKVQGGVRTPFIILSILMLFMPAKLGPFSYYSWATRKIDPTMDLTQRSTVMDLEEPAGDKTPTPDPNATPTPTPWPTNPPPPGAPSAPSAPGAPASRPAAPSSGGLESLR